MSEINESYRTKLSMLLEDLPETQLKEIYHFGIFLKNWSDASNTKIPLPSVPVNHLSSLMGIISAGGDAVRDTEDLYNG